MISDSPAEPSLHSQLTSSPSNTFVLMPRVSSLRLCLTSFLFTSQLKRCVHLSATSRVLNAQTINILNFSSPERVHFGKG